MGETKLSVDDFVSIQTKKWRDSVSEEKRKKEAFLPIITVCMEPGSLGSLVAQGVAKRLEFDLLHRKLVDEMAKTGEVSAERLSEMEKSRRSGLQDLISSIVRKDYLHPEFYLECLNKVVDGIGRIGRAVIVGRGANFILPPEKRFAVRVVAPLEVRVKNIAKAYNTSTVEARERILNRESRRKDFVKESFGEDIADVIHYDLIISTGKLSVEAAVEAIMGAIMGAQSQER